MVDACWTWTCNIKPTNTIGTFSKHGKATEAEPRASRIAIITQPHISVCAPLCEGASVHMQFVLQSAHRFRERPDTVGRVFRPLLKSPFPSTPSLAAVCILHHGSLNHNRNMGAYADTGLTLSKTLSPCAIMKEKQRVYWNESNLVASVQLSKPILST